MSYYILLVIVIIVITVSDNSFTRNTFYYDTDDIKDIYHDALNTTEYKEHNIVTKLFNELKINDKDVLSSEEVEIFFDNLLSKESNGNPEEEEFIQLVISKIVPKLKEPYKKEDLVSFIQSDELQIIVEESILLKFGFNIDDLLGSMSGDISENSQKEIPKLDDLEGIRDLMSNFNNDVAQNDTNDK